MNFYTIFNIIAILKHLYFLNITRIENDNLTWHQVSSLMYFRDPVAELYNISSIPATFVLNEDGIILAKKLRGKALENKISELLD